MLTVTGILVSGIFVAYYAEKVWGFNVASVIVGLMSLTILAVCMVCSAITQEKDNRK